MSENVFAWETYAHKGKGAGKAGKILRSERYKCAFCQGRGQKPRGSKCSICRGLGENVIEPPVVSCAFCYGRGEEHPRTNVTCTACHGKGFNSIKEPIASCLHCGGTGAEPTNKLPCIKCRGKGVITTNL